MVINGQFSKNHPQTKAARNAFSVAKIRYNVNFVSRLFDHLLRNYFTRPCKFNIISGNSPVNAIAILTINFANIAQTRKNGYLIVHGIESCAIRWKLVAPDAYEIL